MFRREVGGGSVYTDELTATICCACAPYCGRPPKNKEHRMKWCDAGGAP